MSTTLTRANTTVCGPTGMLSAIESGALEENAIVTVTTIPASIIEENPKFAVDTL
ncbi:hypothetical protein [Propionimicrobium lymphophilum]|uniref:hypothetical protein n=1 Tax=Propionimicrobium lymphophilum TaxID=33012 RepID=UPI00288C0EE0|nr:hypothetical protein [Propionimicrobium lymphophilum]